MSKKLLFSFAILAIALLSISAIDTRKSTLTDNFTMGNPEIASINALNFGPEGILFIGDSKNATIYALDTKDTEQKETAEDIKKLNIDNIDGKIAASLGTDISNIKITDMAINPLSKRIYFSVSVTDGTPVLLKLKGEKFENVSLSNVSYSKIALSDPVAVDKKDRRGRGLRVWAISDLKYHKGKVMVTGLSNKEFSSTFRSIPFPFTDKQDYASLEIWHAAHGRFETYAPIKTFGVINMANKDYLMASYTCTPLVLFPLDELKGGKHLKGRTVAELGSGNSPVDMIAIEKEGKPYFLMSNTNRGIMRFDYSTIANFKESMTETVEEFAKAEGVSYVTLPFVNVVQLDNLDKDHVLLMRRNANGGLVLQTRTTKWM